MKFILYTVMAFQLSAASTPGRAQVAAPAIAVADAARPAAEIVDAFHAAISRGDAAMARTFLAEDALIFEAGFVERSAAEYSAHHMQGDMAYSKAVPSVLTKRTGDSTGNVAWIASEGRATGSYNGKPVDQLSTETMMLVRSGSSWRIRHIHWSSRPVKK
ncbi:nuclear transport factor 2 family protein [Sandarakinorhabdus limnophila]|jgi:ketosteroid isomerase-like protein|uniref:YybH family protein n=1 Tax=Sandarakinorhabdus limnophila TaxID=210512 RepID=UPI003137B744